LQVDKTPERSFEDKRQNSYQYPRATVDLGYYQNGSVQKLQGFSSNKRTTFQKYKMKPGIYIAKVVVDYNPSWENEFDVNLAVYAQYPCEVKLATPQQAAALAGRQVSWTGEEDTKQQWNNQGAYGWDSNKGWGSGGLGGDPWGSGGGGNNGWGNQGGGGKNNGWGNEGGNNNNGWGNQGGGNNNGWGNQGGGGNNNGWGNEGGNNNGWGIQGGGGGNNNGWGNSNGW
jgi:hypothetical protein